MPDLMIQGAIEFQKLITDKVLALYDTNQIIVPLIQQILENIYLTPYLHSRKVEQSCMFHLLKTIVSDHVTTANATVIAKAATNKRKRQQL